MVAETDNAVSFDAVADRLDYHLQRLLANDGAGTDNTTPE